MIKLTCLSFIYLNGNVCNRVCNNVCAHAIAQRCVRHFLFFSFKSSFFVSEIASYCCLKNEDVQIYQRRLPWNLFYKIHHRLIDMNIHSSVKVILCTIYLNLSKDTKFGSQHNREQNRLFVSEYRYFNNNRQPMSSTTIIPSHVLSQSSYALTCDDRSIIILK